MAEDKAKKPTAEKEAGEKKPKKAAAAKAKPAEGAEPSKKKTPKKKAEAKTAPAAEKKSAKKPAKKTAEKPEKKTEDKPAGKTDKKAEGKSEKAPAKKEEKAPKAKKEKAPKAKEEKKPKAKDKKPKKEAKIDTVMPRLFEKYNNEVVPELIKMFKYKNINQVPKIQKITLNVGMGAALQNSKLLDSAAEDLTIISGQKSIITKARMAVSNFKLRIGNPIGSKVTLRRAKMYEFLDRFISIAIPRVRDFRGLSDKSFDGFGNYSVGIKEQIIFPEIDYDKVESVHGMDISIVTSAKSDEEGRALLRLIGMPFAEPESAA